MIRSNVLRWALDIVMAHASVSGIPLQLGARICVIGIIIGWSGERVGPQQAEKSTMVTRALRASSSMVMSTTMTQVPLTSAASVQRL